MQEQRTAAADDDMARSVVLKKPVQLGDDLSGHSSRDDQSSRSQPGAQPRTQLRSQEGSQRTQPTRSRESEVSQNRIRQRIQAPSSTIGATFLKRKRESEDEEELPRPAVSSVVRVRQRKSSVPAAMQANKLLLLKAVKDTVGDSDGSMASRPPRRKGRSPSESQGPSETRGDFRVTKKVSRDEEMESEHEDVVKTIEDDDKGFKRAAEDDSDYTPTPIKRRLGERNVEEVHRFPAQLLQPEDLRHHLSKASGTLRNGTSGDTSGTYGDTLVTSGASDTSGAESEKCGTLEGTRDGPQNASDSSKPLRKSPCRWCRARRRILERRRRRRRGRPRRWLPLELIKSSL